MRNFKLLVWKWTTSRGQDTYGYNICSLYADGVKMASTCGGGYDMKGTAYGDFIQDEYQERLLKLHRRAGTRWSISPSGNYKRLKTKAENKIVWRGDRGELYGLTSYYKRGETKPFKVCLDGGCGFESMQKIARNIGLKVQYNSEVKNQTSYLLKDKRIK